MRPVSYLAAIMVCLFGILGAYADDQVGLLLHKPEAFEGYNLFSPLDGAGSYLIDNDGRVVHYWDTDYRSNVGYLLENGTLLRTTTFGNGGNGHLYGGGAGHGMQELSWDGEVLWEFVYSSEDYLMHHDIEPLPNGNVLAIAWEKKTKAEAIAAGRDPELLGDGELWPLQVIEVEPTRPRGGKIVWEWHVWDHLIQDYDPSKENYGEVAAHPELVEINPPGLWMDRIPEEERARLEALGYLVAEEPRKDRGRAGSADWLHTNAIAHNAELDQIALSVLGNNEIWIIDHSTTTEEARGHSGGRYGKGGDLLYRWGNPIAYRAGTESDQTLFAQHDVQWIPEGYPGAGNLLIFNNGRGRPEGNYSSVIELAAPFEGDAGYVWQAGSAYGPAEPVWEYAASNKEDFYSSFISGAHRLPNGNTIICSGANGTFFEVTQRGEEVWRYVSPVVGPKGSSHSNATKEPSNIVFRVYRHAPEYPAFAGKDLAPGLELSEFLKEHPVNMPLALESFESKQ